MPDRPYLLLVNSKARSGSRVVRQIEEYVTAAGKQVVTVRLSGNTDASAVVDAQGKGKRAILIAGGDGTLNRAARGLMACGLPLGVIPLGTANDFARTMGLPTKLEEALDVILAGETRTVDLGEVNGHPYFNVASVGFSAMLAKELTYEAKQRWGVLGYALAAARVLMKARPFSVTLMIPGQVHHVRTLQVAVGNGAYYGGGMKVAADAAPDDGALDTYSLELAHMSEMLALGPMLKTGTHDYWPNVRSLRSSTVELYTRVPMPVNADGELVTQTPAVFKVREKALKVFAPPVAKPSLRK